MHIVLFEPEIPPNTGNIARLCAATNTSLHLIEPLAFSIDDKHLRRAGLDYWPHAKVQTWANFEQYMTNAGRDKRLVMTSSKGGEHVHKFSFSREDSLILGPETRGLPQDILAFGHAKVRIPINGNVRSLNLATAAGIVLYAALGQCGLLDEL